MVTRGAGLIGSHIADGLVTEGYEKIVVLDKLTRGRRQNHYSAMAPRRINLIDGDFGDLDLVRSAMQDTDIVFHEATIRSAQCAESPRLAHDVLATGTFNILEATLPANVKLIVAASSASIYGQAEESEAAGGDGRATSRASTRSTNWGSSSTLVLRASAAVSALEVGGANR